MLRLVPWDRRPRERVCGGQGLEEGIQAAIREEGCVRGRRLH